MVNGTNGSIILVFILSCTLFVPCIAGLYISGSAEEIADKLRHNQERFITVKTTSGTLALTFLGTYGGKYFFRDSSEMTQRSARISCINMGMKLVTFDNPEELDYVGTRITRKAFHWTDGINYQHHSAFVSNGHSIPTSIDITFNVEGQTGLVFYPGEQILYTFDQHILRPCVCTITT